MGKSLKTVRHTRGEPAAEDSGGNGSSLHANLLDWYHARKAERKRAVEAAQM